MVARLKRGGLGSYTGWHNTVLLKQISGLTKGHSVEATETTATTWCFFVLDRRQFAIPAEHIVEMVILPLTRAVPGMPAHFRGVVDLRGRTVLALDARRKLGMTSLSDESIALCHMLSEREADHVRWVEALRSAVTANARFELSMDPTRCAFGRWLAGFHTDNAMLRLQLEKMPKPHGDLHRTAQPLLAAAKAGNGAEVARLLCKLEEEHLPAIKALFTETRRTLVEGPREILIVLSPGDCQRVSSSPGLIVDSVAAVRRLKQDEILPIPPGLLGQRGTCMVGTTFAEGGVALLLGREHLFA